jgi:1-deoxy-D-xylulose-5-phosphate reductoisomerase
MNSALVLGSTGSIGVQTLDVVRAHEKALRVSGLAAGRSWEALLAQVREFRPRWVALSDAPAAAALARELPAGVELFAGPDALAEIAARAEYDVAVHGVVGAAGLAPSVAVLERGKTLALANKESLVMAGAQLMQLARDRGGAILPVDSELSAIFQCLRGERIDRVRCVHLTASGGPLRDVPLAELAAATPEMALRHPNWSMGERITIGSATLMNKALEVIEIHHLFGFAPEQIRVLVHRQSVVHSMVEFIDGSVIAQLSPPDMRGPLQFALFHPDRAPSSRAGFDARLFRELTFEAADSARFPALSLGYRCLELGGDAGCVLNAADEIAVEAFLAGSLALPEIAEVNARVLASTASAPRADAASIASVLASDRRARTAAREEIDRLARSSRPRSSLHTQAASPPR